MQVRPEEARRLAGIVALQEPEGVDGPDAVVGVVAEKWVPAVERRVRGPARSGEAQGLEPGGAALGEARDEDVRGAQREAGVDLGEAQQADLRDPEAAVMAEGRKHGALRPLGKGGHHLGEVGREDAAAVCRGGLVALAGRHPLTFALLVLLWMRCHATRLVHRIFL